MSEPLRGFDPRPFPSDDPWLAPRPERRRVLVPEGPFERYGRHVLLFLLTALSVYMMGGPYLVAGLLSILFAHEMGHYVACRIYRVDATLPYFIPAPFVSFVGTLGAFKEKSVERRPGSYVVSGARPGYRDVRRTLVVPVGRSPQPLDVRCDEAL
mgnify:CR=1 FL=1